MNTTPKTPPPDSLGSPSGSPFRFTVGETYELQNGDRVKIVARHAKYRGYETVVDENGCHRYDRSTSDSDAGRVTGTPHDYSHPENIRRENAERIHGGAGAGKPRDASTPLDGASC